MPASATHLTIVQRVAALSQAMAEALGSPDSALDDYYPRGWWIEAVVDRWEPRIDRHAGRLDGPRDIQ